tara:strand:+ start:324 stop:1022 length:699 start_codon:yes stop_codon:yes gene_type:complete
MLKFFKVFLKSFTHKRISYSYGGIDSLILNIFKNQKNGFYLDIGCGHPIKNNNTYLLNKKGWSGINIDLDEENIDLFNSYRKKDVNLVTAVSDKEGETDLYFYHNKSALNTISKENADFQKAKVSAIKRIKTQTINKIIENTPFKDRKIDFLSIDVEGSELAILKNFDFTKYSPKVIVVEYLDLSLKKLEIKNLNIDNIIKSEIYKLIKSNNYTLVNILHSDLVFINNNFRD